MSAPTPRQSNPSAVAALLAAGIFGLAVVVATLTALVRSEQASNEVEKATLASTRAYQELTVTQRAELAEEPQWVEKSAGVLSIPIDRAMTLVLDEIRRDPHAATRAGPPKPSGAAASATPPPVPASSVPDAG
jgi:hypothetical protein